MKKALLGPFLAVFLCSGAFADTVVPPRSDVSAPISQDIAKKRLNFLFFALGNASDVETAMRAGNMIQAQWLTSKSDTANLLMERVKATFVQKDMVGALHLLDRVLEIQPQFFEARYLRAGIYFGQQEFALALVDLAQVLAQEPRHYNAYAALGHILVQIGEEKRALDAYELALAYNPFSDENVSRAVDSLRIKLRGRDI